MYLCSFRSFLLHLLIFVVIPSPSGFGQNLEAYQQGLSQFQSEDYEGAATSFNQALKDDPNNAFILYNWGLSQYHLGSNGVAFAAWRKALSLDPTLRVASKAIDHLLKTRPLPGHKGPRGHWEVFRSRVLVYLPETFMFILAVVFLTTAGWLLIRYFAQRRIAIEEELPLPSPPWLGLVLACLFLVFQLLGISKVYESYRIRGVVVAESVPMKSAPSETGSELFQIAEGAQVLVLRREGEWLQVKYPEGLAGWVPESTIFLTTRQGI